MQPTAGIHHVTAMAGEPQRNRAFYEGVLGLRLVKTTVNFYDPGTYHLYYGDGRGSPGTILTFFPIPGIRPGVPGTGVADRVSLAVPVGSLGAWRERLGRHGVAESAAGEGRLALTDPDGMGLELVESDSVRAPESHHRDAIAAEMAIRGIHGVTLSVRDAAPTVAFLERTLGLSPLAENQLAGTGALGGRVDVNATPERDGARMGAGTIHHVAWRTPDAASQRAHLDEITGFGVQSSPVMDRDYFTSIYFREPGGVLLEVATDGPGFAIDEDQTELGTALRIPRWLEPRRADVEAVLPALVSTVAEGAR
jgi:glyoxalase family protein